MRNAAQVKVFKLFDYHIIVSNLNPKTFCYEDIKSSSIRYAWVSHDSLGKQFFQELAEAIQTTPDLAYLSQYLRDSPISLDKQRYSPVAESFSNDFLVYDLN